MSLNPFLQLIPGNTYHVRFWDAAVRFYRMRFTSSEGYWDFHPNAEGSLSSFCATRSADYGSWYWRRIIDRADGQTKIIEYPLEVADALARYHRQSSYEVGGQTSPDFRIEVSGTRYPRYRVSAKYYIKNAIPLLDPRDLALFQSQMKAVSLTDLLDDLCCPESNAKALLEALDDHRGVKVSMPRAQKTCPDCKGTKKIHLFVSVASCDRCNAEGMVEA